MRRILLLATITLGAGCASGDPAGAHSYGVQQRISAADVADFEVDENDCADFASASFAPDQVEVLPIDDERAAILFEGEIVCVATMEGAARNFQVTWLEGDEGSSGGGNDDPEPEPYHPDTDPEPEPYGE